MLGGLVAVLLIGLLIWWQSAGKYTTVPSVGGLAASTARLEVRSHGLTAKMGQPQFSARVAKGDIIATEPAIGSRVSKGGTVLLIVFRGTAHAPGPPGDREHAGHRAGHAAPRRPDPRQGG